MRLVLHDDRGGVRNVGDKLSPAHAAKLIARLESAGITNDLVEKIDRPDGMPVMREFLDKIREL